jgi:ariadne-2
LEFSKFQKNQNSFTNGTQGSFHITFSFTGIEDCDIEQIDPRKTDPEYFEFTCLTVEEVEKTLNECVEKLNNVLQITPSLAKVLLYQSRWNISEIIDKYRCNSSNCLVSVSVFH